MGGNQSKSEVTKRSYTVYFHKKHSNIDFEVWDDNGEFVNEPNNASKKYLKDSGTSIEELVKNGQFNQHKAALIPGKKRKRTEEEKNRLPKKKKPKILKEKQDLGEWKVSKTPPPNGKIKPWVIKIKKTNPSKTVNKVNTKTTLKCPKVSQGKCTTYYFLLSIQLITKQFPDKRTTRQTKSSKAQKTKPNEAIEGNFGLIYTQIYIITYQSFFFFRKPITFHITIKKTTKKSSKSCSIP